MASRLSLHKELLGLQGIKNAYFQPPESIKLNYPCIVYKLSNIVTESADDSNYIKSKQYTLTLIHTDPDNTIKDNILDKFQMISFNTSYCRDGLNHYVYSLFY